MTVDSMHAWTHVILGICWLYVLSLFMPQVMHHYVGLAILGALIPDSEHFFYIFFLKRNSPYSKTIKHLLKNKEVKETIKFINQNHKKNSFLPFHHMLVPVIVAIVAIVAFYGQKEGTLVFWGAIATHYIYDMFDDMLYLGHLNPNWTRGIPRMSRRSNHQ